MNRYQIAFMCGASRLILLRWLRVFNPEAPMRRLFLSTLCGLALTAIGCTIVIPLESRWQPAGPRRYTLAGVRHRAEVWHAGPVVGWAWRVVEVGTGDVVDASTGRGGSEARAKGQAEVALRRAEQ